jgi:quinol-cytochrome oxidoreductase complex cytochrome b subunit
MQKKSEHSYRSRDTAGEVEPLRIDIRELEDGVAEQKKSWFDLVKSSYVWKSMFRHEYQDTYRNRVLQVSSNVFLHLHPTKIRRHALRLRFTWCMGGITFLLFLILTVTGIILMFYYRPTGEYAYHDMKYLQFDVPFGMIMRNMHRWGAHAMVISVWLHMFRVFMTGSYKPPREFNWVIGVNLLVFTLMLSFTGYLLPWDQLSIWAVTVGTNMGRATPLIGHEGPFAELVGVDARYDARALLTAGRLVSAATLLRFYVLHCILFPVVAAVLMIVHFWRGRKDGGISGPL